MTNSTKGSSYCHKYILKMFVSVCQFCFTLHWLLLPLCCLLYKFRVLKLHLLFQFQLLGALIAYEYSKCLSLSVSFASHCIGCCCLQATLLSFAQFLFCFACASYKSLKLDLNHYLPLKITCVALHTELLDYAC